MIAEQELQVKEVHIHLQVWCKKYTKIVYSA